MMREMTSSFGQWVVLYRPSGHTLEEDIWIWSCVIGWGQWRKRDIEFWWCIDEAVDNEGGDWRVGWY